VNDERISAIKAGLMQYVGSLLTESGKGGAEGMHIALAQLSEVWLECCRRQNVPDNETVYNMFIAKPILRAASIIIKDYARALKKDMEESSLFDSKSRGEIMDTYESATNLIDGLVEHFRKELCDEGGKSE